jgi:hypothetical protein
MLSTAEEAMKICVCPGGRSEADMGPWEQRIFFSHSATINRRTSAHVRKNKHNHRSNIIDVVKGCIVYFHHVYISWSVVLAPLEIGNRIIFHQSL